MNIFLFCFIFGLTESTFHKFLNHTKLSNSDLSKFEEVKYFIIPEECAPEHPAIYDFPQDLFTQEERKNGFVFVHIFAVIYLFIILAILCDFYFVPSLQKICIWMRLDSDVAGATLMAVGSSAPTLFIAIISVFFTSGTGEIGLGTIVGSTIFNTLFIISACGFAVKQPLRLKAYPILRDSLAYLFSTVALIVSIKDKAVHWYEALSFCIIYTFYVIAMVFNREIEQSIMSFQKKISKLDENSVFSFIKSNPSLNIQSSQEIIQESEIDYVGPFNPPETNAYHKFIWVTGWPLILILSLIIPKMLKRFLIIFEILRFIISIILLGIFSYVLVWMVCVVGYTFGIPDCVMGMTLLAAGSSIPDVMASVVVARQDQASMGISNAIGSNVFDMLCLGVPWLLKTTLLSSNDVIEIKSESLILSTSLLIGTMLYTVMCFYLNQWIIDKKIGILFLLTYFSIIIFTTVMEFLACPCNLHI